MECARGRAARRATEDKLLKRTPPPNQLDACFFFVRLTLSRLSTCSSVWLLSIILAYAASVSWMVLSYSLRDEILRARLSLMRASRSVRIRRSFWIFAARGGAARGRQG